MRYRNNELGLEGEFRIPGPRRPIGRESAALAAGVGARPAPRARIRNVRPYRNAAGTIRAFLSVEAPSGMIVNGPRLMIGPRGRLWMALPDIKRRDENDKPVLTADPEAHLRPGHRVSPPCDARPIRRDVSRSLAALQPRAVHGARAMTAVQ